jgi:hypothetical protein
LSNLIEIASIITYVAICLGISLAFWFNNVKVKLVERVVTSAHGALILIVFYAAFLVSYFGFSSSGYFKAYSAFCMLPLISMLFSFFKHQGNKWLHLLHIILIPALAWAWFVGSMYVTGDSL